MRRRRWLALAGLSEHTLAMLCEECIPPALEVHHTDGATVQTIEDRFVRMGEMVHDIGHAAELGASGLHLAKHGPIQVTAPAEAVMK